MARIGNTRNVCVAVMVYIWTIAFHDCDTEGGWDLLYYRETLVRSVRLRRAEDVLLTKLLRKPNNCWECPWEWIGPVDAMVNDTQSSVERYLKAHAGRLASALLLYLKNAISERVKS